MKNDPTNNAENKVDGKLLPVNDPLFEKMKNTFLNEFFPISKFEPGVILLSTSEIFDKFQHINPSPFYSSSEIATFLNDNGYKYINVDVLEYKWLLLPSDKI